MECISFAFLFDSICKYLACKSFLDSILLGMFLNLNMCDGYYFLAATRMSVR